MMEKSLPFLASGRGEKRICQDCGARFYDLLRTPILCPKCGTEFIEVVSIRPAIRRKTRGIGWDNLSRANVGGAGGADIDGEMAPAGLDDHDNAEDPDEDPQSDEDEEISE